jgi:hypothetical protein
MKNEKYHIVETVIKSNRKFVERHKIDIPNTQLHEHQNLLDLNRHISKKWQG